MKYKKSAIISVGILMSLIVLSGFVSANWFTDMFKIGDKEAKGEGELATTYPKNVQLAVAGLPPPPEIVFISDINYKDSGVLPAERDLTIDTTTKKDFEFYVWSDAGVSALPTGAGVTSSTALLTLKDTINPPNNERKSSDAVPAVVCAHNRDAAIPAGAPHAGETGRVYRCSVAMQYYDDYGSAVTPNWQVFAYIKDNFNQEDGRTAAGTLIENNVPLPTRMTYFNPLDGSKLVPDTGSMDFGTVPYGSAVNRQPTDAVGTYPLKIRNVGNKDISPVRLQSSDIPGVTDNTKTILAAWFKTSELSTVCTAGTALVAGSLINTGMAQINNGLAASGDLRVCLTQVLATASVQSYSTTAIGGTAWIVDTTFV